jgi:hypothetical protein
MSTLLTIEDESGTITRPRHPHNGYYAGDFSGVSDPAAVSAAGDGWRTQQLALLAELSL